jgi:hypothetical protein
MVYRLRKTPNGGPLTIDHLPEVLCVAANLRLIPQEDRSPPASTDKQDVPSIATFIDLDG